MRNKKILTIVILAAVILVLVAAFFIFNSRQGAQTNISAGVWENNSFTNSWSDISFSLPNGFTALTHDKMQAILGTKEEVLVNGSISEAYVNMSEVSTFYDFVLYGDDLITSVMVSYENMLFDNRRSLTPEKYFDMVKAQLGDMELRDIEYEFVDSYSNAEIAGEEYQVLQTFIRDMFYQDYYVRKFDNAMIVFTATYKYDTANTANSIDQFLSSIDNY